MRTSRGTKSGPLGQEVLAGRDHHQLDGRLQAPSKAGFAIRRLRNDKGWSQQRLADAMAVKRETVNRVECGRTRVTLDFIHRLAAALGIDETVIVRLVREAEESSLR